MKGYPGIRCISYTASFSIPRCPLGLAAHGREMCYLYVLLTLVSCLVGVDDEKSELRKSFVEVVSTR